LPCTPERRVWMRRAEVEAGILDTVGKFGKVNLHGRVCARV